LNATRQKIGSLKSRMKFFSQPAEHGLAVEPLGKRGSAARRPRHTDQRFAADGHPTTRRAATASLRASRRALLALLSMRLIFYGIRKFSS
jgi:hypothetical protein